ncbi:MAG TPA: 23S rRNA (uracil(1939)-C(5))-methyltransferase RlmD [Candidatus Baltobacteraceae bacterium]|nr:23S rRNA (uracil(1939)-C(5))-methyltransferase RlmD [Candidatus Baltobacteraceae bacterium]
MTIKNTPDNPDAALGVGAQVELGFTDLLANGQAVGRTGGMVVFCFGPLPQERARVRITTRKQRYSVAELVAITRPSPFRAQPFCPVFGICGGCQVQHLSYPAQLGWKRDVVKNALERIGGLSGVQVRDPVGMINPRQYRNKMSLVVGNGRFLGFYKQRSHELVPIEGCPIVLPALNAHIERLNADLRQPRYAAAFAQTRHIVERTARATDQTVVTFTTAQPSAELAQHAEPLMHSLPGAVGLTNSFDLSSQNAIVGRKHRVLAGEPQIEEVIAGVRYRVSAGSFFQVNVEIVGRIFEFMGAGLTVPRSIVDLYCGAGTFSLYFAKMGSRVLGVEENARAIDEAGQNASLNQLGGSARFLCGRVEELVRRSEVRTAMAQANIVFMDPPRKGCDEVTLHAVTQSGVPNIWYLSCDPATLARDLKFLAAKGYRLGVVQPFDMFPQTGHIETLVTLYRQSAMAEQIVAQAFKDVPAPNWPADGFLQEEYPEFVIR